jgi:hypothetical protein
MLKAYRFGEWLPDLPPSGNVIIARNVYAIDGGYSPVPSYSAITPTVGAPLSGGCAFVGSDGTASLLTATSANLYKYSGSAWNSVLAVSTSARWRFCQFGDNIIAANGGTLVSYGLITGIAAAISGAPTATDVATVRDFVFAAGINGNKQLVGWSAFNDSTSWPMDGITNQSDQQPLPDGGEAVAIVGGEYGIILQKKAIRRVTYVGGDVIFQIDVISPEVGCIAQGSVCNAGRLIFFISERGFEMCDGENVIPVADEKFNRWFFSTYSRADIANVWAAIDPRRSLAMWALPGSPGRIICYNWVLKQAAYIETDVQAMFTGFTSAISVDSLGDIDTIVGSLDDPKYQGGYPLLLISDNATNSVGAFSGSALEATIKIANVEPSPGARSRIRSLRPITDAINASATINARMRAGDGEDTVSAATMRSNGKMPIRANGRYNTIALTIPAAEVWTELQGVEVEFEAGDGR